VTVTVEASGTAFQPTFVPGGEGELPDDLEEFWKSAIFVSIKPGWMEQRWFFLRGSE
jgi:hypothetical protein